jgi:uncharacterized OB-fold protein
MERKIFNPTQCGMVICKYCNSHGYIHYPKRQVCPKCGGFGLIKKEKEAVEMDSGE